MRRPFILVNKKNVYKNLTILKQKLDKPLFIKIFI